MFNIIDVSLLSERVNTANAPVDIEVTVEGTVYDVREFQVGYLISVVLFLLNNTPFNDEKWKLLLSTEISVSFEV